MKSTIGTKPKHRGTLRALGLGKIGSTNELPDRPEIRGMLARVPHLVRWRRSHEAPRPEARSRARRAPSAGSGRGIGGKGGKTAGRGSKGQGARNTVSPRFEGGQTPLHRRTPKSKGFTNPFRVEYHVVNLETLEALRRRRRGDARDPAGAGLVAKRGLVKVLGRGELTKSLTVRGARVLGGGGPRDRGRRRHHPRDPAALG